MPEETESTLAMPLRVILPRPNPGNELFLMVLSPIEKFSPEPSELTPNTSITPLPEVWTIVVGLVPPTPKVIPPELSFELIPLNLMLPPCASSEKMPVVLKPIAFVWLVESA